MRASVQGGGAWARQGATSRHRGGARTDIFVTLLVFQASRGWLKVLACKNIDCADRRTRYG